MHGDRAQNFLGWHLYRNEPESFPLGRISSLVAPVGASLAYTDAIPWLAILLKPMSPALPATFQFAGIWIAGCYALQGLFGFLLLRRLLGDWLISLAGTPLLVMSPVLLHRRGHVSLFRPEATRCRRVWAGRWIHRLRSKGTRDDPPKPPHGLRPRVRGSMKNIDTSTSARSATHPRNGR